MVSATPSKKVASGRRRSALIRVAPKPNAIANTTTPSTLSVAAADTTLAGARLLRKARSPSAWAASPTVAAASGGTPASSACPDAGSMGQSVSRPRPARIA